MKNINNFRDYDELVKEKSDVFTLRKNSVRCALCNTTIGPINELDFENNDSYAYFEPFRIKDNGFPYCMMH